MATPLTRRRPSSRIQGEPLARKTKDSWHCRCGPAVDELVLQLKGPGDKTAIEWEMEKYIVERRVGCPKWECGFRLWLKEEEIALETLDPDSRARAVSSDLGESWSHLDPRGHSSMSGNFRGATNNGNNNHMVMVEAIHLYNTGVNLPLTRSCSMARLDQLLHHSIASSLSGSR